MSEEIRLEVKEGWALLVVDRPKQFNAFNTGIVEEMDRLLDQVEANKDIRCLVITGSGEKSFISEGERRLHAGGRPLSDHLWFQGL